MINTQHTPAPWFYDKAKATVKGAGGKGETEAHAVYGADACLISAAPELLEALIGLLRSDDCDWDEPYHPESPYGKARAAINKAKGV